MAHNLNAVISASALGYPTAFFYFPMMMMRIIYGRPTGAAVAIPRARRRQVNNETDGRYSVSEKERKNWVWRLDYLGPSPSPKHILSVPPRSSKTYMVHSRRATHRARNYRGSFFYLLNVDARCLPRRRRQLRTSAKVSLSRLKDARRKSSLTEMFR